MSVSEEDILIQVIRSRSLLDYLPDSISINHIDILDSLAQAGLKLEQMNEKDCDEEGLSLASKAYMFSVIEQVQNHHYNSNNQIDSEDYSDEDFDLPTEEEDDDFFEGD